MIKIRLKNAVIKHADDTVMKIKKIVNGYTVAILDGVDGIHYSDEADVTYATEEPLVLEIDEKELRSEIDDQLPINEENTEEC